MSLLIYGRGKMATLLVDQCARNDIGHRQIAELPLPDDLPPRTIVVHVSSPRHVEPLIAACGERGLVLVQASSGIALPDSVPIPVIDAWNLATPIVLFLEAISHIGETVQRLGLEASVTESHQQAKTSAPITAQKFAKALGLQPESVTSIRDPAYQHTTLGVPKEHLGGHAYHFVKMTGLGVDAELAIKVHGREPYFPGLLALVGKICSLGDRLEPRVYALDELLLAPETSAVAST